MTSIRVLTANLFNGRADPLEFGKLLDRARPDVIAVQELAPNVAPEIASRFRFRDLDARLDHLGLGIGSRAPASFGVVPMAYRPARCATIIVGDRSLELINVRLMNPLNRPWRQTARARAEQIVRVEQFMASRRRGPRLVVGDLNATPIWPAYRKLAESFEDLSVQAALRSNVRARATWAYRDRLPRLLRIDHVFGSDVAAINSEVLRVVGSDHAALVVDLDVPG